MPSYRSVSPSPQRAVRRNQNYGGGRSRSRVRSSKRTIVKPDYYGRHPDLPEVTPRGVRSRRRNSALDRETESTSSRKRRRLRQSSKDYLRPGPEDSTEVSDSTMNSTPKPKPKSKARVPLKLKLLRPWSLSRSNDSASTLLVTSGEVEASDSPMTNGKNPKTVNSSPAGEDKMADGEAGTSQVMANSVLTSGISVDNLDLDNAQPLLVTMAKKSKSGKKKTPTKNQTDSNVATVFAESPEPQEEDSPDLPGLCNKEEERYYVEKVLGYRIKFNRDEFLVKWEGWDEMYNTWQPSHNVDDCAELVEEYFVSHPDQKKKYQARQAKIKQAEKRRLESAARKAQKRKAKAPSPQSSDDDAPTGKPSGTKISLANQISSNLQDFVAQVSNNLECPKTKKGRGRPRKMTADGSGILESLTQPSRSDATDLEPISVQARIGNSEAIGQFQQEPAPDGIQKKKKSSVRKRQGRADGPSTSELARVLAVTAETPRYKNSGNEFQSRQLFPPDSGEVEGTAGAGVGEDLPVLPNGEDRNQVTERKTKDASTNTTPLHAGACCAAAEIGSKQKAPWTVMRDPWAKPPKAYVVFTEVAGMAVQTVKSYAVNETGEPHYLIRFYDHDGFRFVPHSVAVANFPDVIRFYLLKSNIDFINEVYNVHKDPGFNPLDTTKFLDYTRG